jgi:hypothetical protein
MQPRAKSSVRLTFSSGFSRINPADNWFRDLISCWIPSQPIFLGREFQRIYNQIFDRAVTLEDEVDVSDTTGAIPVGRSQEVVGDCCYPLQALLKGNSAKIIKCEKSQGWWGRDCFLIMTRLRED